MEMLKLGRVCVPFGLACNIDCKYCYRDIERHQLPSELNDTMRQYLAYIDPEWCTALVASGGEPLLYWKKIQDMFSCAKKTMHKKIMTNGLLLTQEIVDYCNQNDVEVHFSHDGAATKELRGVDVLENPRIKDLVKQIHILRICGVVTNKNCDIVANYEDTVKKLDGRTNFIYAANAVYDTGHDKDLIDGFDYELYMKTQLKIKLCTAFKNPYYKRKMKSRIGNHASWAYNVDLHGNVIGMATLTKYGTVLDDIETIRKNARESGDGAYCDAQEDCPIRDCCGGMKATASKHDCKINYANRLIKDYMHSL